MLESNRENLNIHNYLIQNEGTIKKIGLILEKSLKHCLGEMSD